MVARNKMRHAMSRELKDKVRPGKVARTEARKQQHRESQELRRQANVVRRRMEVHTPWEAQKFSRRFERQWEREGWAGTAGEASAA